MKKRSDRGRPALDADVKRSVRVTVFLSPVEMLRFEAIRRSMRPIPTQSTLGQMAIIDWVEHKENMRGGTK